MAAALDERMPAWRAWSAQRCDRALTCSMSRPRSADRQRSVSHHLVSTKHELDQGSAGAAVAVREWVDRLEAGGRHLHGSLGRGNIAQGLHLCGRRHLAEQLELCFRAGDTASRGANLLDHAGCDALRPIQQPLGGERPASCCVRKISAALGGHRHLPPGVGAQVGFPAVDPMRDEGVEALACRVRCLRCPRDLKPVVPVSPLVAPHSHHPKSCRSHAA